jgi:hypothetical protein
MLENMHIAISNAHTSIVISLMKSAELQLYRMGDNLVNGHDMKVDLLVLLDGRANFVVTAEAGSTGHTLLKQGDSVGMYEVCLPAMSFSNAT